MNVFWKLPGHMQPRSIWMPRVTSEAMPGIRQKDIHQERPWGSLLWVLLAAPPEDSRKWPWAWCVERREDFKVKTEPAWTFPDLSSSSPGGLPQGPVVSLLLTPPSLSSGSLETYLCPIVGLSW